jgi:hypothetical protein
MGTSIKIEIRCTTLFLVYDFALKLKYKQNVRKTKITLVCTVLVLWANLLACKY